MIQRMTFKPLWAERYQFNDDSGEEVKMGKLFVSGDYVDNGDKIGYPAMSLNCPYEMIDDLRNIGFHDEIELEVKLYAGGKQKAGLFVQSIVREPPKNPDSKKPAA